MLTKEKGATCEVAPEVIHQSNCITYQEIYKIVGEITTLAAIVNDTTKANVFIEYSGHVNCINLRIYKNGWEPNSCWNTEKTIYLDPHDSLFNQDDISSIANELLNMIDPKNHYLLGGI